MSAMTKRWAALYTCMIIGLAIVGVNNRYLFRTHQSLIDQKEELYIARTELRTQAQAVRSLENVQAYAKRKGMVPTSLLSDERTVKSMALPEPAELNGGGLELRTLWR